MATELAEDVQVRVALPGRKAGMFAIQHVVDSAHRESEGSDYTGLDYSDRNV